MYRAKTAGKARYVIFDKEMHTEAMNAAVGGRPALRPRARRVPGLLPADHHPEERNGRRLRGAGALAARPDHALVAPGDFLPLAEETGLIIPIDWWVVKEACRTLHAAHAQAGALARPWVSVNFSAKQFVHPDLVDHIQEILRETGLAAQYLRLEITESVFLENVPTCRRFSPNCGCWAWGCTWTILARAIPR